MNGMIADEGAHGYVVIGSSSICYTSTLDTHKCLYSPDNDLSAAPPAKSRPGSAEEANGRTGEAFQKRQQKKLFFQSPLPAAKYFKIFLTDASRRKPED